MKITSIKAAGLRGSTPEGGWSNEIKPEDCIHTLIAVYTDQGITGWGSAFTSDLLVKGALAVLEPLFLGENPIEPERVSENCTPTHSGWDAVEASPTPSAESILRCGTFLESNRSASGQASGWPLPGTRSSLRIAPHAGACPAGGSSAGH